MKPTADWELVLAKAKDAEERADRYEQEALRLRKEFNEYREWVHCVSAKLLAHVDPSARDAMREAIGVLLLREENWLEIRQANCTHEWGVVSTSKDVVLRCEKCESELRIHADELKDLFDNATEVEEFSEPDPAEAADEPYVYVQVHDARLSCIECYEENVAQRAHRSCFYCGLYLCSHHTCGTHDPVGAKSQTQRRCGLGQWDTR